MQANLPVLVDAMIVIEAVRTGCWNAISGQRRIVTVTTVAEELQRGDPGVAGYVPITDAHIGRMEVKALAPVDAARFRLEYHDADGMDPGERDLIALARSLDEEYAVCSCDKACARAAHAIGAAERLVSLEALLDSVGCRARPPLKVQFTEARLGQWRTTLMLGGTI